MSDEKMFPPYNRGFICYGHFPKELICITSNCPHFYMSHLATGYESRSDENEFSCKRGGYINCINKNVRENNRKTYIKTLRRKIENNKLATEALELELKNLSEMMK